MQTLLAEIRSQKKLFFVLGLLSSQRFGAIPKWFLFGWEGSAILTPKRFPCDHSVSSGFDQQGGHSTRGFQGWNWLERMDGIFPNFRAFFFILNSWEDESFESWDDEFTVVSIGETLGF